MNKFVIVIGTTLAGITLLIIAGVYFIEPAKSLPQFFPGYDSSLITHHYKHGIGAFLLGIACFVLAWFQSGKNQRNKNNIERNIPTTTQ